MDRTSAHTRHNSPAFLVFLLALASCLSGCAIVGVRYTLEEQFTKKQVRMIRNGETTRKDILGRFGPPLAVARPGAVVKIPVHGVVTTGSRDVPSKSVFSRFPKSAGSGENLAVYYYRVSALIWLEVIFENGSIPSQPTLEVTDLWVLIDEKEGKVADHRTEMTEWDPCGFWIWCRDDDEPRPKKGSSGNARSSDRAMTREGSGMPWEGAP